MTNEALVQLQFATRVAIDASAHAEAEIGPWQRAAGHIDEAVDCCSGKISRESLIKAQRHLRAAVAEMYRGDRAGLTPEQNDHFALARSAATSALFELASALASAPERSSADSEERRV